MVDTLAYAQSFTMTGISQNQVIPVGSSVTPQLTSAITDPLITSQMKVQPTWSVLDANDQNVISDADRVNAVGQSKPPLNLRFLPRLTPWLASPQSRLPQAVGNAQSLVYQISALIQVTSITGGNPASNQLKTPVQVQSLPVPSLAVLFRKKDYKENLLLLAPGNGTVQSIVGATTVLVSLRDSLDLLSMFARFTPLRDAVETLLDRLNTVSRDSIVFEARDDRRDLDDVTMVSKSFRPDDDWSDAASSLLAIGLNWLNCYQHNHFGGHRFIVRPRYVDGAVLIPDLDSRRPESNPSQGAEWEGSPGGGWNNCFSSYKWEWGEPLDPT